MENRKATRLENYDYSSNSAYFITVCVKDKRCILSEIVGDGLLQRRQTPLPFRHLP